MGSSPTPGATHLQVRVGLSGPALCASRAAFQGANLNGARLTVAKLFGANLEGANLKWADLSGADFTGANLKGAKANRRTQWPGGFDPVAAGVIIDAGVVID